MKAQSIRDNVKSAPPPSLGNNNNLALRSFAQLRLPRYEYTQRAWPSNSNMALQNLAQIIFIQSSGFDLLDQLV